MKLLLLNLAQSFIVGTVMLAFIVVYIQCDAYQYDFITTDQFLFRGAMAILYIVLACATYRIVSKIEKAHRCANTIRALRKYIQAKYKAESERCQ